MMTLSEAIKQGHLERVTQLIQQQIEINQPCSNGQYPLAMAIKLFLRGHSLALSIIQQLVRAGASLQVLAAQPYLQRLCQLTPPGPNRVLRMSFSPHQPKAEDVQALIDLLITAGIDINRQDNEGKTSLYYAIECHNEPAALSLLKAGAEFKEPGQSLLHMAVGQDMLHVTQWLVAHGVAINALDENQATPLDLACYYSKRTELVSWLLQQGANTNRCDRIDLFLLDKGETLTALQHQLLAQGVAKYQRSTGETLLHIVTEPWLIKELLAHGAAVNAVTLDSGETPVHRLLLQPISCGPEPDLLPNLQQLFQAGARAQATNVKGQTYLHVAMVNRYRAATIIEYLIEQGVPLNARDAQGQTALHHWVIHRNYTAAQILMAHGADSTVRDNKAQTPLEHITFFDCCDANNKESVGTLIEQLLAAFPSDRLPANAKDLIEIAVVQNKLAILERLRSFNFAAHGQRALCLALQSHNLELTVWLLQQEIPVNAPEPASGMTPLQIAAGCLFAAGIKQLLAHDALLKVDQGLIKNAFRAFTSMHLPELATEEAKQNALLEVIDILLPRLVQQTKNCLLDYSLDQISDRSDKNYWPLIQHVFELERKVPTNAEGRLIYRLKRLLEMAVAASDEAMLAIILNSPATKRLAINQLLIMVVDNYDISLLDYLLQQGCSLRQSIDAGYGYRLHLTEYALYSRQEGRLTAERAAFIKQLILRGAPVHFISKNRLNLLSIACEHGWVDIVELLLSPEYGFQLEQLIPEPNRVTATLTPLQVAVINEQSEVVALLLKLGANIQVKDSKQRTLLHHACEKGHLALVKLLLAYGVELNTVATESSLFGSIELTALDLAITNFNSASAELLNALLDKQPLISMQTLSYALHSKHPLPIIERLFSHQPLESILSLKPLHRALYAKRLDILSWLLQQPFAEQLVNSRDMAGRTPLHLIAKLGNKDLFDQLIQQGADSQSVDYEGTSMSQYALYYDTLDTLGLELPPAFNREAFNLLRAQLLEQPEISATRDLDIRRWQLSHYCYKLIGLFNEPTVAKAYIAQYADKTSSQPLHDLCLFNLPRSSQWNRGAWAQLALDHGPELTKYLHLAPAIEQKLNATPRDLAEVQAQASQISYNREAEQPQLAKLFAQYQIPEAAFERVLDDYQPKSQDFMPELLVEGSDMGKPRYQLVKLAKHDPLGFVLGAITHCCQSVGSQGEACAMHGMCSPYSGFYVVYKRPPNYLTLQKVIERLKNSPSAEKFLAQLEDKHQQKKYRNTITDLQAAGIIPEQITSTLLQKLQAELQGEIVAQCWAWISTNHELVFDSWERLRPEDDELCQPMLALAAQQATELGFKRVLLGQGGQTPNLSLTAYEEIVQPKDYADYRDSRKLWQLADAATASLQPEATVQAATITPNLVSLSAFMQPSMAEKAKRDVKQELIKICKEAMHIKVLEAVDNTPQAEFTRLKALAPPTVDKLWHQDKYIVQPILTGETHWSCLIVTFYLNRANQSDVELTYLDPLAKPMPEALSKSCSRLKRDSNGVHIKYLTMAYIEQPEESGPWLLKTLANLVDIGELVIQPEVKMSAAEQTVLQLMPAK